MKKFITLLALTLSLGAFAQERVVVNSSDVTVNQSTAILVRTAATPDKVEVTFRVPMTDNVCRRTEYRTEMRTDGYRCGYSERVTGYTTRTVCVRTNPHNGQCLRTETQRIPVVQRYPRTCPVQVSYCADYGPVTSYTSDKVKIKFKNLPNLGGTEEETFQVSAEQNGTGNTNVVYSIIPLKTINDRAYDVVKKGILGYDSYVIEPK